MKMDKMHRLILEFVLALFVFALFSIAPSVSKGEPVSPLSNVSAMVSSTTPKRPTPGSAWSLGLAFIGVGVLVRRIAA
jgi:hypothetical protein